MRNQRCRVWAAAIFLFALAPVAACGATRGGTDAGPVTLKDFVYARKLETRAEGALGKFVLTREIYEGLIQSQNRDIAVFDAKGERVPFVVLPVEPIYETSLTRSDLPIPVFELPSDFASGKNTAVTERVAPLDIYVRTGADGQIVSIQGGAVGAPAERRYLLDFSAVKVNENADSHRLDLFIPEDARLNAKADVFRSTDLRDWTPVAKGVPLIQLRNDAALLSSSGIDLERAPGRYLLLLIEGADVSFAIKEARYSFTSSSSLQQEERTSFVGAMTADRRAVEYDIRGAFPVSKVNFVLQEPGLHRVRISSRADAKAPWRSVGAAELSFIREASGATRTNHAVSVNNREDRYWRIDFDNVFSGTPPRLRINWRPGEVCFLAQGQAPWILAYGSSRRDLNLQNASLAQDKELRGTALEVNIGEIIDPGKDLLAPGGEDAAKERFGGIEWQRWLVWGILVIGALLLSLIALKLLKTNGAKK